MKTVRLNDKGKEVRRIQTAVGVKPDGVFGPLTEDAVIKFQQSHNLIGDGIVGPNTWDIIDRLVPTKKTRYQILEEVFGTPNKDGDHYLTMISLPYPMRLAWDLDTKVYRMRCHKKVAEELKSVFNDILDHYGYDRIVELGIDLFGGCFEYRNMRGGSNTSTHSWGISIDLDPQRNGLRTSWKNAQFSKPEYDEMVKIFYKHGFINLGKEKNYDSMHFEPKLNGKIFNC